MAAIDPWTEVLAALSLATDLANDHGDDKTLRTAVLAVGLARACGLPASTQRDVFHAALLRFIGCSAFAPEEAQQFGDDVVARRVFGTVDYGDARALWRAGGEALAGETSRWRRLARRGAAIVGAPARLRLLFTSQCEVGRRFGTRMGVGAGAITALDRIHERFDGRGGPRGLRGDALGHVVAVVQVASLAELLQRAIGLAGTCEALLRRRGGALDPAVVDGFVAHAPALFEPLAAGAAWDAFVALGAEFPMIGADADVDAVVTAFADFTDLASVHTLGHSRAVAIAAEAAGRNAGLSPAELQALRRAALLHDLGRVAIPATVWSKRGPLSASDWERIRMHAYHGRRIVARAPVLRDAAQLAACDHERGDGSGYPAGLAREDLPPAARLLAAADVWCALTEARPHRPAHDRETAIALLRGEVAAGRLDREAVDAVLGTPAPTRGAAAPAGLTAREVEVLVWVARGETNKQVAARLGISARTVGHHLEHAYAKIGICTRAAAALFVVEQGLVDGERD
ncbi:MAG: HD domain-containing phosphohydrolase [Nannocystaceae bacterium]